MAATASQELDRWIEKVRQYGPEPLCKALSAFVNWREEILAFFHFYLSSGSPMGL
jgi:transposase